MRISDWISDVFSSDLIGLAIDAPHRATWFAGRCGRYCLCHDPDGLFARNHIGFSGNAKRAKAEHVGRRLSQNTPSTGANKSLSNLFQRCRSEEHTSELQSLMRISYAVFCLKTKN